MNRRALVLITLLSASLQAENGFKPLFNGKNLDGWVGDPKLWRVEKGEIVGTTDGVTIPENTFLITKGEYGDFVLRAKVKLRNGNSGIQFRSEALPNYVVRGYQADMAEGNWWGSLYEEKGRGILAEGYKGKGEKAVKPNDWNDYEITAQGDHIQLKLNGVTTADIHDAKTAKGIIALQLHKGPGMEVRVKDVQLKELPAAAK
jgi:hypothetical protein